MDLKTLVHTWFEKWESGDFEHIPITDDFKHTSPYGTIEGKETYMDLIRANRDKFLGHTFELHDELYSEDVACVRYTTRNGDFTLQVSEWYYIGAQKHLIKEIVAYYNIEGEISEERKLNNLDQLQ